MIDANALMWSYLCEGKTLIKSETSHQIWEIGGGVGPCNLADFLDVGRRFSHITSHVTLRVLVEQPMTDGFEAMVEEITFASYSEQEAFIKGLRTAALFVMGGRPNTLF